MSIKRNAMSMAEVLVALFLMALGSLAILTMFPLGMYRMGQALKDDRTAQSAQQADAFMRMYWRANVVENQFSRNTGATAYPGYEPLVPAFDYIDSKPDLGVGAPFPVARRDLPANTFPSLANQAVPSWPVFVDPMGYGPFWNALNPNAYQLQYWVGGQFYPRRSVNMLLGQAPAASQRVCSLMDGFGFAENGSPSITSGAVDRELRYNWMWVLQRPDNTVQNTATMTIVVFDKRAFQYAPQNAEQVFSSQFPTAFPLFNPPGTAANTIVMQPLTTTVSVPVGRGVPQVQKGGWLMDATMLSPGNQFASQGMRHAIFYRVVSVTDNTATAGFTDIELQTPIRRLDGSTTAYPGTLIHFAGVSEVFERPNLTAYDW